MAGWSIGRLRSQTIENRRNVKEGFYCRLSIGRLGHSCCLKIGRLFCGVLVAAVFSVALVLTSGVSAQSDSGGVVRVWASRLPSGNVEMGLQVDGVNVGFVNRYFPYARASTDVWYRSEAKRVTSRLDSSRSAVLQIQARKLLSGNLEFGLLVNGGDTWLPRARYFDYGSAASDTSPRFSSAYVIGSASSSPPSSEVPSAPAPSPPPPAPSPPNAPQRQPQSPRHPRQIRLLRHPQRPPRPRPRQRLPLLPTAFALTER